MSHADTIRCGIENGWTYTPDDNDGIAALAALDALVAENQQQAQEIERLRDALEQIIEVPAGPWRDFFTAGIAIARKALTLPPPSDTHMVRSGLAQTAKPTSTEDRHHD